MAIRSPSSDAQLTTAASSTVDGGTGAPGDARIAAPAAATGGLDDPADIAAAYDLHGGQALALAYRIVGDHAIAEDVLQEAMLSIWRARAEFDPERGTLRSLLFTTVRNRAIDRLRRRPAGREITLTAAEGIPAETRVEDEVAQRTEAGAVRAAVGRLPRAQAEVVELAYFGGFSQTEVAYLTGTPVGTVKSRTRLALRSLRQLQF